MEWVETTGKTVHDAKEAALDALGVHADEAEFDIVNEERTGMFGRIKEEARVRARVRPATPRAKEDRRRRRRGNKGKGTQNGNNRAGQGKAQSKRGGQSSQNQPESQDKSRQPNNGSSTDRDKSPKKPPNKANPNKAQKTRPAGERKQDVVNDQPSMPLEEQADIAEAFVTDLAGQFGASVNFQRERVADDEIRISVSGDNLGRMIGQRGSAAIAIDELVRTVLQRHAGSSRDGRVRVDLGGVRARRAEALAAFALQQAEEVRTNGVARALEPMSGADRKVVHDTVAGQEGVETLSEGDDPNRRVVIVPSGDAD